MSPLPLQDPSNVLKAIEECDSMGREEFASRYEFARSSRYELIHDDRAYDSAAIVAVAHRYEHGRTLRPKEVQGASTTLRGLGFTILDRTPPWHEDEMVLALDTYLKYRGLRLGKTFPAVRALSDHLRALAPLRGMTVVAKFRNPAGIEQQLGKFLNLDPTTTLSGRGEPSALHRSVWERYANDPTACRRRAQEILSQLDTIRMSYRERALVGASPATGEEQAPSEKVSRRELLEPFTPEPPRAPTRPSAPIEVDPATHDRAKQSHEETRLHLARHLKGFGLFLGQGRQEHRDELLLDLGVEHGDFTWIVEVKSLPERGDEHGRLRSGLGQLLWYRSRWRQRCSNLCVPILCVARRPVAYESWLKACAEAGVVLTWPDRFTTLLDECLTRERQLAPTTTPAPAPTPAPPKRTQETPPR